MICFVGNTGFIAIYGDQIRLADWLRRRLSTSGWRRVANLGRGPYARGWVDPSVGSIRSFFNSKSPLTSVSSLERPAR